MEVQNAHNASFACKKSYKSAVLHMVGSFLQNYHLTRITTPFAMPYCEIMHVLDLPFSFKHSFCETSCQSPTTQGKTSHTVDSKAISSTLVTRL